MKVLVPWYETFSSVIHNIIIQVWVASKLDYSFLFFFCLSFLHFLFLKIHSSEVMPRPIDIVTRKWALVYQILLPFLHGRLFPLGGECMELCSQTSPSRQRLQVLSCSAFAFFCKFTSIAPQLCEPRPIASHSCLLILKLVPDLAKIFLGLG